MTSSVKAGAKATLTPICKGIAPETLVLLEAFVLDDLLKDIANKDKVVLALAGGVDASGTGSCGILPFGTEGVDGADSLGVSAAQDDEAAHRSRRVAASCRVFQVLKQKRYAPPVAKKAHHEARSKSDVA